MSVQVVDIGGKTIISTFAGCGGSSLGYHLAGYKELLAIEWEDNAVQTFKLNFPDVPVWQRDIKTVTAQEILDFIGLKKGELFLFDGSPPCQGFSTAGKRKVSDPRNDLFKDYARLVNDLQPKVFVMENVSGMIKGTMKGKFIEIMQTLKGCGYNVKCKLMNAMWYDVPQSRERLIFIGIRTDLGLEPSFPKPNEYFISVKEAWKHLPKQTVPELAAFIKDIIPKMKQGQKADDVVKGKGFQTFRIYDNKPCPTITKLIGGIGFGALIHPNEDRVLSVKEMQLAASFPESFKYIGKYQEQKARIGNSVPPNLMKAIAKHILTIFEDSKTATKQEQNAV